jgi:prepilin-type N-terminal cleavage/methylation domain-containing protein
MRCRNAFTLVEILTVVVILGVLSAIVVPQFTNATNEASSTATMDQLVKLREALGVYYVRNNSTFPSVTAGDGSWGELIAAGGDYLKYPPKNNWIGGAAATIVTIGSAPDTGWQTAHGWIYDPATGNLWAGSFDGNDQPFPKP